MNLDLVCISDTHNKKPKLPRGDVLFHGGDLTYFGNAKETMDQISWLGSERHKYKEVIVVPGNHDHYIEKNFKQVKELLTKMGITLLHNESVQLSCGVKVWGSGHTPIYEKWALMLSKEDLVKAWSKIPEDVDIVLTHCPPAGVLDKIVQNKSIGCSELAQRISELNPKIHIFGHAHESHGTMETEKTLFCNAALSPIVIKHFFKNSNCKF